MREDKVINIVIRWLSNNNYKNIKTKTSREHDVDITANTSYNRFLYIECKGDGSSNQVSENNFVYALGQIVTRMKRSKFQRYAVAYPKSFERKLNRIPWLFAKRNNLFVLLVDDDEKIERFTWKELKKYQELVL
ncbi:MAG: hypothetical protein WC506_05655 [Candidatus Micrarchaeia archaeon]